MRDHAKHYRKPFSLKKVDTFVIQDLHFKRCRAISSSYIAWYFERETDSETSLTIKQHSIYSPSIYGEIHNPHTGDSVHWFLASTQEEAIAALRDFYKK